MASNLIPTIVPANGVQETSLDTPTDVFRHRALYFITRQIATECQRYQSQRGRQRSHHYTRRGGIDICPSRANQAEYLPEHLQAPEILTQKLLRQ